MLVEMKPQGYAVYVDGRKLAEYETEAEARAAVNALECYALMRELKLEPNGEDPAEAAVVVPADAKPGEWVYD